MSGLSLRTREEFGSDDKCNIINKIFLKDENIKTYKKYFHINTKTNIQGILANFIKNGINRDIILDYRYFKLIAIEDNYEIIINTIIQNINENLKTNNTFTIHIYMKSLTLTDLDKYYPFICRITEILKTCYPDKLEKCYIYDAPFIFKQIFSIVSIFIDKKTQLKIQLFPNLEN